MKLYVTFMKLEPPLLLSSRKRKHQKVEDLTPIIHTWHIK